MGPSLPVRILQYSFDVKGRNQRTIFAFESRKNQGQSAISVKPLLT